MNKRRAPPDSPRSCQNYCKITPRQHGPMISLDPKTSMRKFREPLLDGAPRIIKGLFVWAPDFWAVETGGQTNRKIWARLMQRLHGSACEKYTATWKLPNRCFSQQLQLSHQTTFNNTNAPYRLDLLFLPEQTHWPLLLPPLGCSSVLTLAKAPPLPTPPPPDAARWRGAAATSTF